MTENLALDYAEQLHQTLDELWVAIEDGHDEYDGADPTEYLDDLPLEVVHEVGEPFAVVLTVGGPTAEIVGGGRSGGYRLEVHWGTSEATVHGPAITCTGEYFREMYETA